MPSPKSYVKIKELHSLDFEQLGSIAYNPQTYKLEYRLDRHDRYVYESNCVYLWARSLPAREEDDLQICYIGQTGQNIYHRRSTWQSGLNAGHRVRRENNGIEDILPGRGNQMRRTIRAALDTGSTLTAWVRLSQYKTVLGERVPIAKAEEDALIQKFEPNWNWHGLGNRYDENDQLIGYNPYAEAAE